MRNRGRPNLFSAITLAAWHLAFAGVAGAQHDDFSSLPRHTLKVDVNLVTLNFSVTDKHRRNIGDLRKEDLVIYEDEVSQEIAYLDTEPMPVSLVVLVDVSESTGPFSRQIENASRLLPDLLRENDDAAVIAFSNLPNLIQEFTRDKEKIRAALYRAKSAFSGATNINDSIYLAAKKFDSTAPDKRKVILLISDGKGNRGERERAFAQLKSCGATLLGIGVGLTATLFRGGLAMNQWVKGTGGNFLFYSPESDMRLRLQEALDGVRRRYAAAYVPSNRRRDGSFRRLRVEISQHSPLAARSVTIEGPEGYFAPGDSSM